MLFLPVLTALLGCTSAFPLDTALDDTSLDSYQGSTSSATSLFERREKECHEMNTVLKQTGTSKMVAAWSSTGGLTCLGVCRRRNRSDCSIWGGAMASVIGALFLTVKYAASLAARDIDGDRSLADFLARELALDGAVFDSVTDVTPRFQPRDTESQRPPVAVASVHGLIFGNESSIDIEVYDFGNGDGHIYLPLGGHDAPEGVGKRAAAPGFKVSYTTRLRSKLTRPHQIEMSQRLARYWVSLANCCDMHDLMGFVETGHKANFYFRIIPETVDFGLNYETVDACGGMAQFL